MANRKTRKVTPRNRTSKPLAADLPLSSAIKKEATSILRVFDEPTEEACGAAREALRTIIEMTRDENVSAKDSLFFILGIALSGKTLPGYATLDYDHICDIRRVLEAIKRYQEDESQKRPLNFLMLASPGAGKSHFIRCTAAKLGTQNIGAVTYNMVGLQRHEDLIPPLDAARNFKVEDRLPLLFLDEFDVHEEQFALLLPLLWDGQLTLGQHDLKLGKVVIVLAGSDPRLPGTMEHARSMKADAPQIDAHHPKLVDLLSRINGGVLPIPKLSDPLHAADRSTDKICIAAQLLRQRFGGMLRTVPVALLRFIASTEFRYGVRSIAHLIDLIPYEKGITDLTLPALKLPLDSAKDLKTSSLAYHLLSEDQAHGVINAWKESRKIGSQILIHTEALDFFRFGVSGFQMDFLLDRLWLEVQMVNNAGRKIAKR